MAIPTIINLIETRVKDTGDTITGNLVIEKSTYPSIALGNTTTGTRTNLQTWDNSSVLQCLLEAGNTDNRRGLFLKNSRSVAAVSNALALRDWIDGTYTEYKIYGEHNKDLIKEVCLPIEGGTINASSGDTPLYIKSGSASTWIGYKDSTNTTLGFLGMKSDGPAYFKDQTHLLLHAGNYNNYSLSLKGGSLTGNITITVDGNPYYGLNDGTNNWYFQAVKADNACYIGPGYTLATKIDTSGNMTVRGNITVNTAIVPDVAGGANVGTGSLPFLQTVARNHYLYDTNNVQTGRFYTGKVGTTSEVGQAYITIGNSKASGTANNAKGFVVLYGDQTYYSQIVPANGLTAHRTITLPNASGTVALTSNLSSYLPLAGGTMTGNLSILTGNSDRYIIWDYSTDAGTAGASWRIGMQGSGSGDANYFVIQTTGSATGTSETFANAVRIGMDNKDVLLGNNLNLPGSYQQNGVTGRLASITSSSPSLTTSNKMLWAW